MRAFVQEQNQPQITVNSSLAPSHTATQGSKEFEARLTGTESPHFGHDFSRVSIHPPAAGAIQTKPEINKPGDEFEREADRVSEQVMRVPETQEHERMQTRRVEPGDSRLTAVPPIVHEVLRSAGQSLDSATRAFVEPRFGHDFSQVRVHTDSKAAESARDLNANAYTVGRNIVFGAGQFLPETQMGRRLLTHELTHVVQQQRSGPTCPPLQRQTPQSPSPAPRQPPTAPPPPRPLDYDRDPKKVAPVPQGQTAATLTALLKDEVKKGDITAFAVRGVQPGSRAEIFLLALIYGMAQRSRWGTESDIVTAIDWPAKPGALPPQGRVTVRIDDQGAASAELIATGPVPAVAQTTVAAGSAKLITDFGFASVAGWKDTLKDAAEISDVLAALELLKSRASQDVPALKGVDLIRVPSLGGQRCGEFFAGSQVVLGATADVTPWLKLADCAFSSNTVQFFGGGPDSPTMPASFQVILHEVGHAVETEQLGLAREGYVKAAAELEAAKKLVAGDPATYDAELKAARRKGKLAEKEFYKKQEVTYKKNVEAEKKAFTREQEESRKLAGTRDPASQHTRRLQKFIDLVNANNIRRFTRYSAQNWQQNPEEFYAEAYSLWLADPAFMRTNYRVVYDFFQSGEHRK
jgi:hypothetical protein